MALNPREGLVYFPGQETSMVYVNAATFDFTEGQWNTGTQLGGGAAAAVAAAPTTPPGRRGFVVAWDPVANTERWRIDFNPSGGALSTAGQLIFIGDNGGTFMALDPATGKTLWQHKLLPGIATPVTYALDGRQYVAVMSGVAGGKVFAFTLDGK
jgi:outer membrane protein assembly factor BamB